MGDGTELGQVSTCKSCGDEAADCACQHWLPMATAPKDGTWFCLRLRNFPTCAQWDGQLFRYVDDDRCHYAGPDQCFGWAPIPQFAETPWPECTGRYSNTEKPPEPGDIVQIGVGRWTVREVQGEVLDLHGYWSRPKPSECRLIQAN